MIFRAQARLGMLLGSLALTCAVAFPNATRSDEFPILRPPTLGGAGHWSDYVLHGDWRIQKHANSNDYRLLDGLNRKVTVGSVHDCFLSLDEHRASGEAPPMPRHVVVVMHGLAGSRALMSGLERYLEREGGYTVLNFGYASTKGTIQEHTLALESVLRNLRGVEEISLVAHSMSNIMFRHLLFRAQYQSVPLPVSIRRMVMISPPNHGSALADSLGQRAYVQFLLGASVDQFARSQQWYRLEQQLAVPGCEFGIIAGGRGNDKGYLSAIPGDDDGIVEINSHYLPGASDFIQTGGLHQVMPLYPDTRRATLSFLKCGHFRKR